VCRERGVEFYDYDEEPETLGLPGKCLTHFGKLSRKMKSENLMIAEEPTTVGECEGAALGVLMWLPAHAGARLAQLAGYVFAETRHKLIFEAILSLSAKGQAADLGEVIQLLTEKGTMEGAGGVAYLKQVVDTACTQGAYRFGDYVRALRGNAEGKIQIAECQTEDRSIECKCDGRNEEARIPAEAGTNKQAHRLKAELQTRGTPNWKPPEGGIPNNSSGVEFREAAPWDEPVDGAALLNELRAFVSRYVVLPPGAAEILALWVLHTYAYRLRRVTTYVAVVSPEKRCGKTTLLTVLSELANRALLASNVSPPSIFRAIEECEPTLLIDEGDTFLEGRHQLRGILNAGYTRESAFVLRAAASKSKEKGGSLKKFSCWCPKVIASIGGLPETLADRCIVIVMKRKSREERCERFRGLKDNELGRKCARFVLDHAAEIAAAQPAIPEELNDRAADIREPLLALADIAGGEWPELARKVTVNQRDSGAALDLMALLFNDLESIFETSREERMHSRRLVDLLTSAENRPWSRARHGGPINERWLATKLRPYGIEPRVIRTAEGLGRGYCREDFGEVWQRYAG
jgi:putative DNA primase/helicase